MKINHPVWRNVWEYCIITLGCAIYAFSFNCFFLPNDIVMGGFTGVAQILNRLFPILPIGALVFVMNAPLMVIGVRKMGWKLLVSTLFAVVVSSTIIDGLELIYQFPPMDPLLATVYGGGLLGIGTGLLMRVNATTGGTELAARLLKFKLRHLSIGKLCLTIDVLVIALYAITFRSINNALYGIMSMYISSLAMDMVVYGSSNAKMAYIISERHEEISRQLLGMEFGLTVLSGQGAYSGNDKRVLMCAVKRNQITAIKAAVTVIDPNAFIIVCEAHEVLGEGFGEYSPDSL